MQNTYEGNKKIVTWVHLQCQMLQNAMSDSRTCLHTLVHQIKSSPMTYLMLGNKSKDGFNLSDLFRRSNGRFKSLTELKNDIPFQQMARLVQVYTTAYNLNRLKSSLTKKVYFQTRHYQM